MEYPIHVKVSNLVKESHILAAQVDSLGKQFTVEAMKHNGERQQQIRDEIHALIDRSLDIQVEIAALTL